MAENKTTLNYNEDETVLTIEVNEKNQQKYNFVPYPADFKDFADACKPCAFYEIGCNELRCCNYDRLDCTNGYFKISEQ